MAKALSAADKRLKRRVLGREFVFLAVVQPAFLKVCREELTEWGFRVTGETDGGLEFAGSLKEGWRANLVLGTASRVYVRVCRFRAGAREELFKKVSAFPWELWLPALPLRVESRVIASRLQHEGASSEAFVEGLGRHYAELGLPAPRLAETGEESQRALLRLERNICEISLDMSGSPLYERGYRNSGAQAPIRESLACALLREAGWRGRGILADCMTGSATFSVEASLRGAGIPPGGARVFRFQSWPSFGEASWAYMKKAALSRGREASFKVFASDISADALALGKENAEKAGVSGFITWEETDFFSLDSRAVLGRLGLVNGGSGDEGPFLVINPPYGKRLSGGDEDFFRRLGKHCRKNFPGWKVLALFPDEASLAAFGGKAEKLLRFRHGGLRITAGFFCLE